MGKPLSQSHTVKLLNSNLGLPACAAELPQDSTLFLRGPDTWGSSLDNMVGGTLPSVLISALQGRQLPGHPHLTA